MTLAEVDMVIALINRLLPGKTESHIHGWELATHWWRAHLMPSGLLPLSTHTSQDISLEASAATVPGLYRWGFHAEAQHMVDALLKQQQPDGSWQNNLWLTGHILMALMADMKQSLVTGRSFRSAVERGFSHGCDWVYDQVQPSGELTHISIPILPWQAQLERQPSPLPDSLALLAMVPLGWAAKVANKAPYRLAVERALRYYLLDQKPAFTMPSPYYAQLLWALDQLGQSAMADKLLLDLPLTTKGEIPALATSHVVHVPALLLWSQVYYNLGHGAMGKHLFERALTYQQPRTGAFPTLSQRNQDVPLAGIAWYMQALDVYITQNRDAAAVLLPDAVAMDDPRMAWLTEQLAIMRQGVKLLEVQSGKGRYSKVLHQQHLGQQWHVVEPSANMLQGLSFPIQGREGSWQQLPYPDGSFDVVFGVDSLSQSVYVLGALRETARVLQPGGHVLLIEQPDAPASPWRIRLRDTQWQDALKQAGFTIQKTATLPDGAMALVAQRA
jgi:hypothetical protein